MDPGRQPTVGQASFGVAFFLSLTALCLVLLRGEADPGNRVFLGGLAALMAALAGWRATYLARAVRSRR